MRLVHNQSAGERRSRRGLLRLAATLAPVATAAWLAGGASAATTVGVGASPSVAQFCGVASNVRSEIDPAANITPASVTTSLATLETKLKTAFTKIESEEPAIISAAPSAIQADLKDVFAVDNVLFKDLQAAHWNFLALAADEKTLEAQEAKIAAPLAAIKAYFASKCH